MRSGRHLHFRFLQVVCWRCRPVSSRLVRILQIRAFPFRHCTEFGSPSQNRTEVGRFRAGRFATKLRGGSCFAFGPQLVSLRCSAHRPRASKARTLLHELQAVLRSAALPWERRVIARRTRRRGHRRKRATQLRRSGLPFRRVTDSPYSELAVKDDGAHGRIRTRIFNSDYGSPVRSRRRLRARVGAATGISTPVFFLEREVSWCARRPPREFGSPSWIRIEPCVLPRTPISNASLRGLVDCNSRR